MEEEDSATPAAAPDMLEGANGTALILELLKAIRTGQDNIPPHVHTLLGDLFSSHLAQVGKWMEKEGLNERQFQKLLWKSKKGLVNQITSIKAALSKSCGKAYRQTKESTDAATDTDDLNRLQAKVDAATDTIDLVQTANVAIESVPFPTPNKTDENGDGGSMGDDESTTYYESSSEEEDASSDEVGGATSLLSDSIDSAHALAATTSNGVRRSTRQRPAPQASSPSPQPKPKKTKSKGRKKTGKKKMKTTTTTKAQKKAAAGKDTGSQRTTDAGVGASENIITDRDLAGHLALLEYSHADDQQIQNVINELQQRLDELGETDGGGQDNPFPQYAADAIPVIKMVVETLKMFVRGDITTDQLKQAIADFVTFLEPYQEVIDHLLVLEKGITEDLISEQKFRIKGKTLGDALKSTKDDSIQEGGEASQMDELDYARGVVKIAQEATGTSCKTSLLECLRLKNTLRNAIRFILNFRVAIDVLERGTVADFLTTKKDRNKALKLAKGVGALNFASTDCNAMHFFSAVIFQCSKDNSSAKVELILAFVRGMKGFKRNEKLKDMYRKAATLDITSGEYKGESDYFDGKDGEGRINLPSMTFMVFALGDDVDEQLVKVGLVSTTLDFAASVFGSSIRTMEKAVGFVAKPKFWTGSFDAVRGSRDPHKLTRGDVLGKVDGIYTMTDEKMGDYQGKYMLMHVNNTFLEAIIRFQTILCASLQARN